MSINSLSGNNTVRISGLNSGLDTESLVTAMTAYTKGKIDSKDKSIQTLQWKQTAYRTAIDKLATFQNKYLDILNTKTYLGSASLFNAYKATSSSSAVTATASSTASESSYTLNVEKAATAQTLTSGSLFKVSRDIKLTDDAGALNFGTAVDGKYSVKVKLGANEKTVTFDAVEGDDAANISNFNAAVEAAFGTTDTDDDGEADTAIVQMDANGVVTAKNNSSLSVTITNGTAPNTTTRTQSNRITTNSTLAEASFNEPLIGDSFRFTINGVEFSFDRNTTIGTVMSQINRSADAHARMTYSPASDSFTLTATQLGTGENLVVEQTEGNLFTSLFGMGYGSADDLVGVQSMSGNATSIGGLNIAVSDDFNAAEFAGKSFTLKSPAIKDGDSVTITLKDDYDDYADMVDDINKQIKKATGTSDITVRMSVSGDSTASFSISSDKYADITLTDDGGADSLLAKLGFGDGGTVTNVRTLGQMLGLPPDDEPSGAIGTVMINGVSVTLTKDMKLETLAGLVGGTFNVYDPENPNGPKAGTISGITTFSGQDDDGKNVLKALFGVDTYEGHYTSDIPTETSAGQNAVYTIDGTRVESNSNSFIHNGVTISFTEAAAGAGDITIGVAKDPTSSKAAIMSFVEDYNTLINELNGMVNEKPNPDYGPLTDDERSELSESQIEKWESQAKLGLLYQDTTVSGILGTLRTALMGSVDSFSLSNMGITTSSNYQDNGKLMVDETKLDKALADHSEDIVALFTAPTTGLYSKLDSALDAAISTTGDKGTLIRLAGASTGVSALDNSITEQIASLQDIMDSLEEQYESEQERYWNKFTALESTMAQLNSQQSYIASLLGGGSK